LITLALTTLGKRKLRRDRPASNSIADRLFNLRALESNFSFPSGDSAQGAALAIELCWYARAFVRHGSPDLHPELLLLLIPLTMTSRVYFGAHYWGDTIAGVLCGLLAVTMSWEGSRHLLGWHFGQDHYRTHRVMTWLGFLPAQQGWRWT
jgi:membrane-associated phospholipid phosphatase